MARLKVTTEPSASKALSKSSLAEIVAFATEQIKLEERIAKGQALLKELGEQHRKISTEDLPTAMAEAGLKEFTLSTGQTIEVSNDFSVGIPEAQKQQAFDWLKKNKYEAIIKTEVTVRFGKGELPKALALAKTLMKQKLEVALERGIHWQTLKSFVKERAKEAKPVPPELFGVHALDRAVIKLPKP